MRLEKKSRGILKSVLWKGEALKVNFSEFSKQCKFKETKLGMWTSGMQRECLHGDGGSKCLKLKCPIFKRGST